MVIVIDDEKVMRCARRISLSLVALAVLLVVIGVFIYQHRKLKKTEKELQEQLSTVYTDKTVDPEKV